MIRALIIFLFCVAYQILLIALTLPLGVSELPLMVAPVLIAYAVFFQGHLDALLSIFGVGFFIDVVSGMPIGINMLLIFLLWFLARAAIGWLGKPHWSVIFLCTLALSFLYRLTLGPTLYFFTQTPGNLEWDSLLWVPLLDGAVGIVVLRVLHNLLVQMRLTDSMEDVSARLSSRRYQRAR